MIKTSLERMNNRLTNLDRIMLFQEYVFFNKGLSFYSARPKHICFEEFLFVFST